MNELYKDLEEKPYIDAFHYIEWLGEKIEDKKLIKINRFLQEDRKTKVQEIERLNNIINNAIETIKDEGLVVAIKITNGEEETLLSSKELLLDILKGE